MNAKRLLTSALCCLAFGLAACGDEASTTAPTPTPVPVDPNNPGVPTDPVTPTDPVNPSTPTVVPQANVPLATVANMVVPTALYGSWLSYHYVTLETESTYYSDIAGDFSYVFANYSPAARVIWASQGSGYYKDMCSETGTTIPTMKYRACTVSEGIGYGMLITNFQGDKEAFDRLWNYSRGYRSFHKVSLTPWITKTFTFEQIDNSSATDADLDIATSLIIMYYKTNDAAYLQDALSIAGAIWDKEVNPANLLLYSGDTDMWHKADPAYNLSYFSPVALRLFAMVDPSHNWTGVLDAMYAYMALVQAGGDGTGVFPDWSNAAGMAVNPPNESASKTYWTFNKESVRIPWRIAWDYYWFKDERAAAILNKLNAFIVGKSGGDVNSSALAVNYSWSQAIGKDAPNNAVSSHWFGAWCLTGIASNPTWLEACTAVYNAKTLATTAQSYFPDILLMMMSQLLNGVYVRPF